MLDQKVTANFPTNAARFQNLLLTLKMIAPPGGETRRREALVIQHPGVWRAGQKGEKGVNPCHGVDPCVLRRTN